MRKPYYYTTALLLLLSFPSLTIAQTNSQNWVKQIVYKKPGTVPLSNTPADSAMVSATYFDGLGRPIQQIANQQSETGKDIITHIEYDLFGRPAKQYLPYAGSGNKMAFTAADAALYNTTNYAPYAGQNPFSEKEYEESPLSRVLKMAAPGDTSNWAMGSGHELKFDYLLDSTLREVKATDENGHTSLRSQDVYTGLLVSKGPLEGTDFYGAGYYYDTHKNLVGVQPPQGPGYYYDYDSRNRLKEKKQPGKQTEFIVYDELDRIVATGPAYHPYGGNDSGMGWIQTRYDKLNRPAYTIWVPASFHENSGRDLQNAYNGVGIENTERTGSGTIDGIAVNYTPVNLPSTYILLSVAYYDDYGFPGGPTSTELETAPVYYNNTRKPKGMPTGSWSRILENNAPVAGITSFILYDYKGRAVTAGKTNHLGGYTKTVTSFNDAGQPQKTTTHHKQTAGSAVLDVEDRFAYTAQGRLFTHAHQIGSGGPVQLLSENRYDALGRLKTKFCGGTFGGTPLQQIDYNYNIRGWLTHINDITDLATDNDLFAFKIGYDKPQENIAGLMPQYNGNISETFWRSASDNVLRKYEYHYDTVNRMTAASYKKPLTAATSDSYREEVTYDLNGNITHLERNGNADNQITPILIDRLNYSYGEGENSNRLMRVFDDSNSLVGFRDDVHSAPDTDDDYTYDNNGNLTSDQNKSIESIRYNHLNLPVEIVFDAYRKIRYLYTAGGEKIRKEVQHNANSTDTTDYLDGFQYRDGVLQFFPTGEGYVSNTVAGEANHYNYVFNYLDHLGNIRLSYGLDENGQLKILEENHYYPYGLKHTNYNTTVKEFQKSEATEEVLLKQLPDDPQAADKIYKYKFNGMEWQDELGLNLYDMDMRDYDPAIGRWLGIDPITHFDQSPYMAMNGDPVYWADPSGADGLPPEAINTWHFAGSGTSSGAGNLSNGDHMFGSSGDAFWGGQTAFTGGDLAWNNYNRENGIQTFYGGQARTVFSYLATVNGWTSYMYPDSESTVPGNMGVGMYQKKAPSYLDNYFAGYFNGVNSGEFGPSSMIPDASGFSVNLHVKTGFMGEFYINGGFAASRTNEIAFFGGYGGNFGWNGTGGIPSVGGGLTFDMHNNFGGNTDVLSQLGGTNKSFFVGAGYGNGSYSKSAISTKQGWIFDKSGVSTTSIGLGFGLGAGMGLSHGGVWRPFK